MKKLRSAIKVAAMLGGMYFALLAALTMLLTAFDKKPIPSEPTTLCHRRVTDNAGELQWLCHRKVFVDRIEETP